MTGADDVDMRKSRAAARRAKILASSSSRMAVVTGVADSRTIRSEVSGPIEQGPVLSSMASSDEDNRSSLPSMMSLVQFDIARRRLDLVYSMVLFLFWVGAGVSQGMFGLKCSIVELIATYLVFWALFALGNRCLRWWIQAPLPPKDVIGQLAVVGHIAEFVLQGQRVVRDCVNGIALVAFIYVVCQHGPLASYYSQLLPRY